MNIQKYVAAAIEANGGRRISSMDLAKMIRERDPERWQGYSDMAIAGRIADHLSEFGWKPRNMRFGKRILKGYERPEASSLDV
jgi:hypothetical protein